MRVKFGLKIPNRLGKMSKKTLFFLLTLYRFSPEDNKPLLTGLYNGSHAQK